MPDSSSPAGPAPAPHAERAAVWRRYLRFWGPQAEADVDDELGFHIEMRVRDYITRGLSEADARAAVARRLGDLESIRRACVASTTRRERRMTRAQLVDALVQDVRFALRTLAQQKGWTAVAILTLSLGIGANTAVFSAVNALLLHPLPYPDVGRIAVVYQEPSRGNNTGIRVMITPNAPIVRAWREHSRSLEDIEPYTTVSKTMQVRIGEPALLNAAEILPSFPRFAGQQPLLGRAFTAADVSERARVAMLSEGVWRSRYASDPTIIGKVVSLDDQPYTVVGVMPASFRLRSNQDLTDVWLPLDLRNDDVGLSVLARLRPGATYASAGLELDSITARATDKKSKSLALTTRLVAPRQMVSFHDSLVMLSAAVALVLLIACANVAHLQLARAASRERELAIRTALGAGRARIVRQLLTESLVLAVGGCAGGVLLAWAGLRALVALRPESLSELGAARLDTTTLGVTVAISAVVGVVVGLLGALHSARYSTHQALKAGAPSTSSTRGQRHLRSTLVITEMAVSMMLLVGATLLMRSVAHMQMTNRGFDSAGLYAITPRLPEHRYTTPASRRAFFADVVARARALPGVRAVTLANATPPMRNLMIGALQVEGEPLPPMGTTSFIDYNGVEPVFFSAMGIRLLQGSTFTDTSAAAGQVIVNEGMARKYWRGRSALGHRLRVVFNGQGDWKTIVGVAANASTAGLTADAGAPMLYLPTSDMDHQQPSILLRTTAASGALPSLRALVAAADPRLPPAEITSIDDAMARSIAGPRFTMLLLASFTVMAVVLAAVGLYGVIAYAVAQRTREIGIRVALGASRRRIARAVITDGALLALAGVAIGTIAAWWATKLLEEMLYGVARTDPVSFAAGGVLLLGTALVACLVPMRRAVLVDPLIAMRSE